MIRGAIEGQFGPSSRGMSESGSCVGVNTDLNWSFKIVALDLESENKLPLDLRGATPIVSWRLDLT